MTLLSRPPEHPSRHNRLLRSDYDPSTWNAPIGPTAVHREMMSRNFTRVQVGPL